MFHLLHSHLTKTVYNVSHLIKFNNFWRPLFRGDQMAVFIMARGTAEGIC